MFFFVILVLVWLLFFVLFSRMNGKTEKTIDRATQQERDDAATLQDAIREHNRSQGPAWARENPNK